MKVLTISQTITEGNGKYWWRDWQEKTDGGQAPARPNAVLSCYIFDGDVFNLLQTRKSGMAGGFVDWTCERVQSKKIREYVLSYGIQRGEQK